MGKAARESTNAKPRPKQKRRRSSITGNPKSDVVEVLNLAQERGLLSGARTHVIRGRMPISLVEQAKLRTGIRSDTKLLQAALANLAVSDDYAQWLLAQRETIHPDLDLEF